MIRVKFIRIWALIIIIFLWIYGHRKLCNFSIKHEISALNSDFQQSSSSFVKGLEFRYAWYKINQYGKDFQPFWYLIEPAVCKSMC